jgi:hypothetical protein
MTRNNALRGAAWLGVLVIANATPLGTALHAVVALVASPHELTAVQQFIGASVLATVLCFYTGRVAVALWGNVEAPQMRRNWHTAAIYAVLLAAVVVLVNFGH